MSIEKRKYKRFFFPKSNTVILHLGFSDKSDNTLKARLLDISEGGIGVVIKRNPSVKITKDTEFIIKDLNGMDSLKNLNNTNVKVKWVLDYKPLGNIGIGCAFEKLNTDCKEEISRLMF